MAVKVVFNAFSHDDSRYTEEFDADAIVADAELPNMLRLEKGGKLVGYVPQVVVLSAVIK